MGSIAAWYLVSVITGQFIGPLTEPGCQMAVQYVRDQGIVCRRASVLTACDVPGRPGSYTACPVFDFVPEVTVKP